MAKNPLYQKVVLELGARIRQGVWLPGGRLPGEQELSRELNVGRSTLREGMRLLQEMGYIEIRNGVGSFVREPDRLVENPLTTLSSTGQMIQQAGYEVGALNQWVRHMEPEPGWAERLALKPGERVVTVCRERTAKGKPIACAYNIFPEGLVGESLDFGIPGGVFAMLKGRCGAQIHYALTSIKAIDPLSGWDVSAVRMIGSPSLLLEQLHYDQNDRPVLFSLDYIRTDMMSLTLKRERKL